MNNLDGVYVYDMDSLKTIAHQSMEIRRRELDVCEERIEKHVLEFSNWLARSHIRPTGAAPEGGTSLPTSI